MPSEATWKDYIFPVFETFLATLAGAYAAFRIFLRQERVLAGRKNVSAANQLVMVAHTAMQELIRCKSDYFDQMTSHPYRRASAMHSQIAPLKNISFPISELGFLVPKGFNALDPKYAHVQLLRLDGLSSNFNTLCDFLKLRANYDIEVRSLVAAKIEKGAAADLDPQEFEAIVPNVTLVTYIDLTEHCLCLIDDLLIEFDKVLADFPEFANKLASEKGCSKDDRVFKVTLPEKAKRFIARIPAVDYAALAAIMNIPQVELIDRYDKGLAQ